jgi:hypothetical protein
MRFITREYVEQPAVPTPGYPMLVECAPRRDLTREASLPYFSQATPSLSRSSPRFAT